MHTVPLGIPIVKATWHESQVLDFVKQVLKEKRPFFRHLQNYTQIRQVKLNDRRGGGIRPNPPNPQPIHPDS
jgi:hypothetical protein